MELLAQVMVWVNWAIASGPNLLVAVMSMLSAMIAVALLIPGSEPEATLSKWVDFLSKFSKK